MPAPFAALESMVNAACMAKFANALLRSGAYEIEGEMSDSYAPQLGIVARKKRFRCKQGAIPCLPTGCAVQVFYRGILTDYTIREIADDGTGLVDLILESA